MPHITIEYSANLAGKADIQGLCDATLAAALRTGVFETGAVRVRAIPCAHYAIADGAAANSFIDASLRLAAGRDLALRKSVGDALFAAMQDFLTPLFESRHFALSFEVREIDPQLSYKKNAIHERLRAKP
jgi:5-carboxymethyl-2-hydroxymuconate isomerase